LPIVWLPDGLRVSKCGLTNNQAIACTNTEIESTKEMNTATMQVTKSSPTFSCDVPTLESVSKSQISDVEHLTVRGDTFLAFGRYEEALADLNLAIRLDPKNAKAYASRAVVFIRTNDFEQAFADLKMQIMLDKSDAMGYCNRGALFVVVKRFDRAIADLCEAIRLDSNCAPAYANLGEIYFKLDRFADAISCCTKALELFPASGESHFYRGKAFEALGQFDEAQADLDRSAAIGYTPGTIESYYRRN
jgi:tetratricopeptide (TPR) repeat protein